MSPKKAKTKKAQKKKYQIEMTSTSIFLWGFCFFFLLAWIFVLGILVGRGFLPGAVTAIHDLKGQISKLQGMVGHKSAPDPAPERTVDQDPKLAFYEKLSSKKDEAKKGWQPEKAAEPPIEARAPKKAAGVEEPARKTTADTVPVQGKDSEFPEAEAKFTVQVASLADREKAEKMIEELRNQGLDAYTYEADVSGRMYYRIRCGRFKDREDAGEYAQRLFRDTGLKGFVSRLE
ncbi:MAG: SPOR domain-containing protein [Deltaproteobacteria bacterium]|nr:SPOR domain-containing protein [Deltaproteobacteria bacterium]